jgi:large subunit ribosomal protein L25
MAGERIRLEVRPRERVGSSESRRMRRDGLVPGVLYGRGNEPTAFCVPERELRRALTGAGGLNAILDVVVEGTDSTHPSVLKDYQQDPLRGRVTHIDLFEVRLDQPIHATVPITLVGEAQGSKEGGVLTQVLREVTVEALPMEVPEHLDVDVSELQIGESLRVSDLKVSEGVAFLDDPDGVVAAVTLPTRVEEPELEEVLEGEEGVVAEGEEAPEGGEAPGEPGDGEPGTAEG